jgi:hypothetical protein
MRSGIFSPTLLLDATKNGTRPNLNFVSAFAMKIRNSNQRSHDASRQFQNLLHDARPGARRTFRISSHQRTPLRIPTPKLVLATRRAAGFDSGIGNRRTILGDADVLLVADGVLVERAEK